MTSFKTHDLTYMGCKTIRILHRLLVQTGISISRVTVYDGNEALLSFR
jgi:hypothetical protein